ncbi:MAG: exodeoxyribonuclease VII small subunit [Pseudomonadota bacterium]|nr:MAG: exodeoxyribonuclease VII small subunit [Pseudomonadota bacterium]
MSTENTTPQTDNDGQQSPDFETALAELEQIVAELESGQSSLAESLAQFRRGVELSRHCHGLLDSARQSVEQLLDPDDENSGQPLTPDSS